MIRNRGGFSGPGAASGPQCRLPSFSSPCSLAVLLPAVAMGLPPQVLGTFSESPCSWYSQSRAQWGKCSISIFLVVVNKIHTALQCLIVDF